MISLEGIAKVMLAEALPLAYISDQGPLFGSLPHQPSRGFRISVNLPMRGKTLTCSSTGLDKSLDRLSTHFDCSRSPTKVECVAHFAK